MFLYVITQVIILYRCLCICFSPQIFLWGLCFSWVCAWRGLDQRTGLFKQTKGNFSLFPTYHKPKKPGLCVWSAVGYESIMLTWANTYKSLKWNFLCCVNIFFVASFFSFWDQSTEIRIGFLSSALLSYKANIKLYVVLYFFHHSTSGWTFQDWDEWETVQIVSSNTNQTKLLFSVKNTAATASPVVS